MFSKLFKRVWGLQGCQKIHYFRYLYNYVTSEHINWCMSVFYISCLSLYFYHRGSFLRCCLEAQLFCLDAIKIPCYMFACIISNLPFFFF